ncbi:MAG: DUF1273 family protein [Actinobacteria bacterium]|nr:DUF1273 family protein [Actinomycetota bacterium]
MPKRDPIVVFTDGACLGNPGPGGWAWAVPGGPYASGVSADTTNQRMEILAAYEAIVANGDDHPDRPVEVVSDSTYVVNCFRDRWFEGWRKRGWRNSQRQPVANRDLWEPLVDLVESRGNVTFRWVKGHSGDPMNDLVDRLAVEASQTQKGRSGYEPPRNLGPADKPARRPSPGTGGGPVAVGSKTITGYGVAVFGPKPPELGGYGDNPTARAVRQRLADIFRAQTELHDDLRVVSGMRLGAEMLGAEAAIEAGIPLVVVLPYPDPEKVWPADRQRRFRELVEQAEDTILLQRKAPESKQKAAAALKRRDAWLVGNAAEAVLVWDEKDDLLGKLHRSLEQHLGDDVWVVNPNELTAAQARRGTRAARAPEASS